MPRKPPNLWELWKSKDPGLIRIEVPSRSKGYCNCRKCLRLKPKKEISGTLFWEHMNNEDTARREEEEWAEGLAAQASAAADEILLDEDFDMAGGDEDYADGGTGMADTNGGFDADADGGEDEPMSGEGDVPSLPAEGVEQGRGASSAVDQADSLSEPDSDTESGQLTDFLLQDERARQEAFGNSLGFDSPEDTPPPSPEIAPSSNPFSGNTPPDHINPYVNDLHHDPTILRFPHTIPPYLLDSVYDGHRPTPHPLLSYVPPKRNPSPIVRGLFVLIHTMVGVFNSPRREVDLVLNWARVALNAVHDAAYLEGKHDGNREGRRELFAELRAQLQPGQLADDAILAYLSSADPGAPPIPTAPHPKFDIPKSSKTVFKRLDLDDRKIVHPVCRNHDCNHIWFACDMRDRAQLKLLPTACPHCGTPVQVEGKVRVLQFPRRSLVWELERLLQIPGMEEAIESRADWKAQRDKEDAEVKGDTSGKKYRHQDDGSDWPQGSIAGALHIVLNWSLDWADANSSRRAATDSFGPISMHVADLAFRLRSTFTCCLILGITPGPRAPSAANLWKFLLPLMLEIRIAYEHGVWVKTPKHPTGRLVQVSLGLIVADRPAAIDITGGPHYQANDSPCLRCTIPDHAIHTLHNYPDRDSDAHNRAAEEYSHTVPIAVRKDIEVYDKSNRKDKAPAYRKERMRGVIISTKALTGHQGNLSVLALMPGYNKFLCAVFDPMHSCAEGVLATYVRGFQSGNFGLAKELEGDGGVNDGDGHQKAVDALKDAKKLLRSMQSGVMGTLAQAEELDAMVKSMEEEKKRKYGTQSFKAGLIDVETTFIQKCIAKVIVPTSTVTLNPRWGEAGAGTPSASQWRSYGTIYGPLTIPFVFANRGSSAPDPSLRNPHISPAEEKALMGLFEWMYLAFRSTISEAQITRLDALIRNWLKLVFAMHPELAKKDNKKNTNFHVILHLCEDIRRYGPIYGWWSFLVERLNFVIKNFNRSGGSHDQEQVVAFDAMMRCREVVGTQARELGPDGVPDSSPLDQAVAADQYEIFSKSDKEKGSTLFEQMAARYAAHDKAQFDRFGCYPAGDTMVKLRGNHARLRIDAVMMGLIRDCLSQAGMETMVPGSLEDTEVTRTQVPLLAQDAVFWQRMEIDARHFVAAEYSQTAKSYPKTVDQKTAMDYIRLSDSSFEMRDNHLRFSTIDQVRTSGIISAIFEYKFTRPDGRESVPILLALIRRFAKPAERKWTIYRKYPSLDIWEWRSDCLGPPMVIPLSPTVVSSFRPLAKFLIPDTASPSLMLTIPCHHH